jgi:hypothetical protein
MQRQSLAQFITILQTAIGPALLISGVGLLLLAMTNRLNHITDRVRAVASQMGSQPGSPSGPTAAQLTILWHRARLIRLAIVFGSASALLAALLVVGLFLSILFGWEDSGLIGALFVFTMGALIASLLLFLADINQSLRALKLEVERAGVRSA